MVMRYVRGRWEIDGGSCHGLVTDTDDLARVAVHGSRPLREADVVRVLPDRSLVSPVEWQPDQKIRVHCYDGGGRPTDVEPVYVSFAEPSAGQQPMVAVRYIEPDQLPIKFTPVTSAPVRCQNAATAAVDGRLRISIRCYRIGADAVPADTGWQLSYVEGTGLHHDPSAPAAYATVDGTGRSFASNGEVPTVSRQGTGMYTLHYNGIGRWLGGNAHVTAIGPEPRHCTVSMNAHSFAPQLLLYVKCFDARGRRADSDFAVSYQRVP
jgi:hypothetical protein